MLLKHTSVYPRPIARQHFINDEISHTNPKHQSKAIRVSIEDYIINDEKFYSAYYKKSIDSFSDETIKNSNNFYKAKNDKNN